MPTPLKQKLADRVAGYFFKTGELFTVEDIKIRVLKDKSDKFIQEVVKILENPGNKYRVGFYREVIRGNLTTFYRVKGLTETKTKGKDKGQSMYDQIGHFPAMEFK